MANNPSISNATVKQKKIASDVLENELSEVEQIKATFIEEAKSILGDIDNTILALESSPHDITIVDQLYRKIHTIKGSSGSLEGTENLASLAHALESLLTSFKERKISPNKALFNIMLRATDEIKMLIDDVKTGNKSNINIKETINLISQQKECSTADPISKTALNNKEDDAKTQKVLEAVWTQKSKADLKDDMEEGVTVSKDQLDNLMTLAVELATAKNHLQSFCRHSGIKDSAWKDQVTEVEKLITKTSDLFQDQICDVRKVKVVKIFTKFPRLVRQTADMLKKKIKLDMEGQELSIDKSVATVLSSSLVHIIRNSCDHGIETEAIRTKLGKPSTGTIRLAADQKGDFIVATVEDDGAGLDREKIINKAVSKKLLDEKVAPSLSDDQVFDFIFAPGFSTAEIVSAVSGRGVGMDVVRTEVASAGGSVKIESEKGKFCRIILSIPIPKMTLVEHSILGRWNDILLAIPLDSVIDIKHASKDNLVFVENRWVYKYYDEFLPFGTFKDFANKIKNNDTTIADEQNHLVVIMHHKKKKIALKINEVVDQLDAIIKRHYYFDTYLPGVIGTSVVGREQVAYVISPEFLVESA